MDGIPEFSAGVYVSGNYYVAAQRLNRNDRWIADRSGYVAVIDQDGNEINTGKAAAGSNLLGIELPARNPIRMYYNEDLGKIIVQCQGQYGNTWYPSNPVNREFTGGITHSTLIPSKQIC